MEDFNKNLMVIYSNEELKMEETKRKAFSIPKNYVTLQQLKERKMREKEQKQEEEEAQRRIEEQRVKEEEQEKKKRKEEEQEKKKRKEEEDNLKFQRKAGVSSDHRPYRSNFQKISDKCYVVKEKNDQIDNKLDEMKEKTKKKKSRKNKNKILQVEENLIGELEDSKALENSSDEGKKGKVTGIKQFEKKPPSKSGAVPVNPTVEIGVVEVNPEVKMQEKNTGKIRTRNPSLRWEKTSSAKQAEVPISTSMEVDGKPKENGKCQSSEVNPIPEKTAGKINTRNGLHHREKKAPSEEVEIPMNVMVEIEQKTGDAIVKSAPLEVNPGKKTTQSRSKRWEKKSPSEQIDVPMTSTVEIEKQIGDLTFDNEGDQKISTSKNHGVYPKMKYSGSRRSGYGGTKYSGSGSTLVWVRKDE